MYGVDSTIVAVALDMARSGEVLCYTMVIKTELWTRVHSPVVGAADCRSAGPWFKSGCALARKVKSCNMARSLMAFFLHDFYELIIEKSTLINYPATWAYWLSH